MKTEIRKWYIETFKTDELGTEIRANVNFKNVLSCLANNGDIYTLIGVGDSVVRERIFEKIAELLKTDYDTIYNLWIEE